MNELDSSQEENLEDLATALETDTETVRREDLPSKIREAAQQHLRESVIPSAGQAALENDSARKDREKPA